MFSSCTGNKREREKKREKAGVTARLIRAIVTPSLVKDSHAFGGCL